MPSSFYTVPLEACFFGKKPTESKTLKSQPNDFEEVVRQWCLAELQSTYGVSITNIKIECPVKVGSKNYRADIVVLNEDSPYIVIECKRRNFTKHEYAIEQAISYAGSANIKAEFAVYTNGDVWSVKRRVNNNWITVPDIPFFSDRQSSIDVCQIMYLINDLWPILNSIREPVTTKESKKYLESWHRFFYVGNLLTDLNHRDLIIAADHFFRVASCVDIRNGYLYEKTAKGCYALKDFSKQRQLSFSAEKLIKEVNLYDLIKGIDIDLHCIFCNATNFDNPDILLLRFISLTLKYIQESLEINPKIFSSSLCASVRQELQNEALGYLRCVLKLNLNWRLPDEINDIGWDEISKHTEKIQ